MLERCLKYAGEIGRRTLRRSIVVALAPLLCLAPALSGAGQAPAAGRTAAPVPAGTASLAEPLDLNTATPAQLRILPGMGDAYVRRVIEGRPYTAKNQLVTRGILPQAAYDRIRDQIVAHRVARP